MNDTEVTRPMRDISNYTKTKLERLAREHQIKCGSKMQKAELYAVLKIALTEQREQKQIRERDTFYQALRPNRVHVNKRLNSFERTRMKALMKTAKIPLTLPAPVSRVPFFDRSYGWVLIAKKRRPRMEEIHNPDQLKVLLPPLSQNVFPSEVDGLARRFKVAPWVVIKSLDRESFEFYRRQIETLSPLETSPELFETINVLSFTEVIARIQVQEERLSTHKKAHEILNRGLLFFSKPLLDLGVSYEIFAPALEFIDSLYVRGFFSPLAAAYTEFRLLLLDFLREEGQPSIDKLHAKLMTSSAGAIELLVHHLWPRLNEFFEDINQAARRYILADVLLARCKSQMIKIPPLARDLDFKGEIKTHIKSYLANSKTLHLDEFQASLPPKLAYRCSLPPVAAEHVVEHYNIWTFIGRLIHSPKLVNEYLQGSLLIENYKRILLFFELQYLVSECAHDHTNILDFLELPPDLNRCADFYEFAQLVPEHDEILPALRNLLVLVTATGQYHPWLSKVFESDQIGRRLEVDLNTLNVHNFNEPFSADLDFRFMFPDPKPKSKPRSADIQETKCEEENDSPYNFNRYTLNKKYVPLIAFDVYDPEDQEAPIHKHENQGEQKKRAPRKKDC